MRRLLPVLLAALPAGASADDACTTVKAAFDRLATVPAYRQTVAMPGMPVIRSVSIGDVMYLDQGDGAWRTVPLAPGMREQMMASVLPDAAALEGCGVVGTETLDGIETTVVVYTPPPIGGMAQGPQKVWIADGDGLPRRMTAEMEGGALEVTIAYDGVTAPVP